MRPKISREVERAEVRDQGEHADQEGEVADAVDDERLLARRGAGTLLVVVEADQEVGAEPHALPADEHDQVVVAQDQQQHRAHEQVQVGEVAAVARLVAHVADGVDVDQKPTKVTTKSITADSGSSRKATSIASAPAVQA